MPSVLPAPSDLLADLYGSLLISSWITMSLYGLTTAQTYIYWVNYPQDNRWTKALILFLWVLNTAYSSCMGHICYYHLITVASSPDLILLNVWSFPTTALLYVIVAVTVMLYYMKLIFHLSSNRLRWWLVGIIAIPVVLFCAFALDGTVRLYLLGNLADTVEIIHNTILPAFITQVISDGLITVFLCVLLYNKRTNFKRTRAVINTLVIYAATRGLLTLIVTLVMVIALAVRPDQMWYTAAEFITVGLYTNSLMTSLNTRYPSGETTERIDQKTCFGFPGTRSTNIEFTELGAKGSTSYDSGRVIELKTNI